MNNSCRLGVRVGEIKDSLSDDTMVVSCLFLFGLCPRDEALCGGEGDANEALQLRLRVVAFQVDARRGDQLKRLNLLLVREGTFTRKRTRDVF